MFAPLLGEQLSLSFPITWISTFSGGLVSAMIFYFGSEYFMKRYHLKKAQKIHEALASGQAIKTKKNFTRINKALVKFKHSLGQKWLSLFAPLFLSVPIGSIVCAKFFGKKKSTFPLIIIGLAFNSGILTLLAYIRYFI